jgi:hypothetical protein
MIDLARQIWPALAAAFVLGLLFGGLSRVEGGLAASRSRISLAVLLVALAALGLAAALDVVPGRPGLWLDSAVLHLALYLVGCGLGWLLSRLRAARADSAQEPG